MNTEEVQSGGLEQGTPSSRYPLLCIQTKISAKRKIQLGGGIEVPSARRGKKLSPREFYSNQNVFRWT